MHPGKLTWNLKITCLKRKIIFQTFIFQVPAVNFAGVYMSTKCLLTTARLLRMHWWLHQRWWSWHARLHHWSDAKNIGPRPTWSLIGHIPTGVRLKLKATKDMNNIIWMNEYFPMIFLQKTLKKRCPSRFGCFWFLLNFQLQNPIFVWLKNNKPKKLTKSNHPRHSSERSHALNAELIEMMVLSRLPSLENRDFWASHVTWYHPPGASLGKLWCIGLWHGPFKSNN